MLRYSPLYRYTGRKNGNTEKTGISCPPVSCLIPALAPHQYVFSFGRSSLGLEKTTFSPSSMFSWLLPASAPTSMFSSLSPQPSMFSLFVLLTWPAVHSSNDDHCSLPVSCNFSHGSAPTHTPITYWDGATLYLNKTCKK